MKSFFKKLLPFLSFFFLVSCSNGVSKASLVISVGNSTARSAKEDLAKVGLTFESFEYVIDVTYPDNFVFEKTVKWGDSLSLDVFDQGYYSVQVKACLPNVVEFLRENMDDGITEQILAEELGKYESYKDLPLYKGVQTKYVSAHGVTPFSIKLKLTPFFGGEDESDPLGEGSTATKSYDEKVEFSSGERHRVNLILSDEVQINEGDTVVFYLTGKLDKTITNLNYQFVYKNANNEYKNYEDSYCLSLSGIEIPANEEMRIPLVVNQVYAPDGLDNPAFDCIQLFYVNGEVASIKNCKLEYTVYPAEKKVFVFSKAINEDIYRDSYILRNVEGIKGTYFNKDKVVSVTISGKSTKSVELHCNIIDGSAAAGYYKPLNWTEGIFTFGEDNFSLTENIVLSENSYGTDNNQIQLYCEADNHDLTDLLYITDFGLSVQIQ